MNDVCQLVTLYFVNGGWVIKADETYYKEVKTVRVSMNASNPARVYVEYGKKEGITVIASKILVSDVPSLTMLDAHVNPSKYMGNQILMLSYMYMSEILQFAITYTLPAKCFVNAPSITMLPNISFFNALEKVES